MTISSREWSQWTRTLFPRTVPVRSDALQENTQQLPQTVTQLWGCLTLPSGAIRKIPHLVANLNFNSTTVATSMARTVWF
jgi:hypothetical protein